MNYGLTTKDGNTSFSMPLWPLLEDPQHTLINPAYIYRDTSPNAYSWQFDDISATFQCRNADYKIIFCEGDIVSTPTPTSNEGEKNESDAEGLYIGVIVGLLLVIVILIGVGIMYYVQNKNKVVT